MTNPYQPSGPIKDANLFVGRKKSILNLHNWLSGQMSVNIVGLNQYGKTSLLINFDALVKKHIDSGGIQKKLVYVNLQDARVHSQSGLFFAICQQISKSAAAKLNDSALSLGHRIDILSQAIRRNRSPVVIILDEIEVALTNPAEFPLMFWQSIRSMQTGGKETAFVLAGQLPLYEYDQKLEHLRDPSSPWYNFFITLPLDDFSDEEVNELFELSDIHFNWEERLWIKQYGDGNPSKLQLACFTLYEMKSKSYPLITKNEFYEVLSKRSGNIDANTKRPKLNLLRRIGIVLLLAFLVIPTVLLIGVIARQTGNLIDVLTSTLIGAAIIILLILGLIGKLPLEKIREYAEKILGFKKD